jgi:hypothetical protein
MRARRPGGRTTEEATAVESTALARLCAALHPVLRARDVAGFRRVLAAAEDILGDTSELLVWPDDRLRALMADMLREPRRFGLPRWPVEREQPAARAPAVPSAPQVPDCELAPAPRAGTLPLPGFPASNAATARPRRPRRPRRQAPPEAQQLSLW